MGYGSQITPDEPECKESETRRRCHTRMPSSAGCACTTFAAPPQVKPSWRARTCLWSDGCSVIAGDVTLDGDVTTGFLGADLSGAGWLAGAALAHSKGAGTFALTSGMDSTRDRGTVESTLTSVLPYARMRLSERVSAWGLAGWGTGEFTLTEEGATPIETGLTMTLGAVGAAGDLVPAPEGGGFALALRTDAFWVRTESDAAANLSASDTDVTRLRLVLDASRAFETAGGTLTPSLEVGLRHDGGDAETGSGIEVGAGLRYAGSGRGLSLTLAPTIAAASSGTGNLWSAADARGLAPGTEFEAERRLDAEVGYGLAGPGRLGTVTPYAGLGLAGRRCPLMARGGALAGGARDEPRARRHAHRERRRRRAGADAARRDPLVTPAAPRRHAARAVRR